jgi:hydrogenase maturation factor HypF (carbamoyltransferase family)
MSVKSSFIVDAVGALWRPRFDALALGIDARLRLAWSEKGKIFALSFAKKADDPGEFYRAGARFLRRRKGFCPRFIAFDPHPYFECSRQAAAFKKLFFPKARLVPVFHHVAHAALCAFTHGLEKKFLTLAWDGTGYGADAKVWGGEFLVYQNRSFCRAAHFDYQFLPGNESAVLEPWRMAFAMLYRIYGEKVFSLALPFLKKKSGRLRLQARAVSLTPWLRYCRLLLPGPWKPALLEAGQKGFILLK